MAEQLDPSEIVDLREPLMSEVIQSETLINLLDRKGIISKKELLEDMKGCKHLWRMVRILSRGTYDHYRNH